MGREIKVEPVDLHEDGSGFWVPGDPETEMTFWPRTLWIDPGVTTGIGIVWFDPETLMDPNESSQRAVGAWWGTFLHGSENNQVEQIGEIVKQVGGENGLHIGIEDFILQSAIRSRELLSPVRITAAVSFMLARGLKEQDGVVRKRNWSRQMPSEAKSVITNERLRMAQMWTPGPDHVNDAMRHCNLFLRTVKAGGQDLVSRYFGYEKEWYR